MKLSKIKNNLSFVPIQIGMRFGEIEVAIGTAFFYLYNDRNYFVTNWHNVTGRRPTDHGLISKTGCIPNNIACRLPFHEKTPDGLSALRWIPKILKIYDDEENRKPIWWEFPELRNKVDVVVIDLEGLEDTVTKPANDPSFDLEKLNLTPGMDVFVLGYPMGMSGGARFPIWKRGSIASEPDIDLDGLPKLYIDTATREGMSGSPVFAQESGFWAPEGKSLPEGGIYGKGNRFLGVYSGRVGDDTFQAQLGIVWKEEAIVKIIEGKIGGRSSFEYKRES